MMFSVIQSLLSAKSIFVHPKFAILFSAKQCFNFYPYNDNKLIYSASFSYRFFKFYLFASFSICFYSLLYFLYIFWYRSFNYCNIYTCSSFLLFKIIAKLVAIPSKGDNYCYWDMEINIETY